MVSVPYLFISAENDNLYTFHTRSKAKVAVFKAQAFLAAQTDFVDSVGLGAQKRYWNFDSPALDELKHFLENLA
jgi:hypothetical protein